MSVKERITRYLKSKKLSARGFSLSIGMSENYISSMKNSIQPDVIDNIAVHYPDLNTGWLLTGNGEMLNPNFEETGRSGLPGKSVPYWNLPVTAGRSLGEIIGQLKPDGYISGLPGADMAQNILPVTGTSMEPEVPEGALIGVRKMDNLETLNTGRIYLIITHDDRMIKRIEHDTENEAILWCTSPNYPKFKIYKSDIIEIHRVCFIYFAK